MSRNFWWSMVIVFAIAAVFAGPILAPKFLNSARGSYSGLVTVSAKTDATELPMMGYLLTMRHKTEFAMLSPGSKEHNWQPPLAVSESREERVRGGFSSGWTWT